MNGSHWAKLSASWTFVRVTAQHLLASLSVGGISPKKRDHFPHAVATVKKPTKTARRHNVKKPGNPIAAIPHNSTTTKWIKLAFKFKPDQVEVVKQAIAKAKGELKTEFDTVAVEHIMAGYIGGLSSVSNKMPSIEEFVNVVGFEPLMIEVARLYPMYEITIAESQDDTEAVGRSNIKKRGTS